MCNRFYSLSKDPPPPKHTHTHTQTHTYTPSLFLTDSIKLDRITTKVNDKYMPTLIWIWVLKVLPFLWFHVTLHQLVAYMSRYHFSQIFKTSYNLIWKNIFVTSFSLLTIHPNHHSNGQHLRQDTKFLSILSYGEENILQALMAPEYWEALE